MKLVLSVGAITLGAFALNVHAALLGIKLIVATRQV
jgi:hypothetical protein